VWERAAGGQQLPQTPLGPATVWLPTPFCGNSLLEFNLAVLFEDLSSFHMDMGGCPALGWGASSSGWGQPEISSGGGWDRTVYLFILVNNLYVTFPDDFGNTP
jgi:hypothetical protein